MDGDRTFQQMIESEIDVARQSHEDANPTGMMPYYWDGYSDALKWVLEKLAYVEKRDRVSE